MNASNVTFRSRPKWTHDLSPSERRFLAAMNELGFGRFEFLRIEHGELLLDPWPKNIRDVKFGSQDATPHKGLDDAFELRPAVVEFFEYVRAVEEGQILCLTVKHGLPFSMQIERRPEPNPVPCTAPI